LKKIIKKCQPPPPPKAKKKVKLFSRRRRKLKHIKTFQSQPLIGASAYTSNYDKLSNF
jgi:hypothetical protein